MSFHQAMCNPPFENWYWSFEICSRGSRTFWSSKVFFIIWLAPWAGKMSQIARSDWLPERARWSYLARSGLPAESREKNFLSNQILNPLLTKLFQSRWLDIGLVLFRKEIAHFYILKISPCLCRAPCRSSWVGGLYAKIGLRSSKIAWNESKINRRDM